MDVLHPPVGTHLLADLWGCTGSGLDSPELLLRLAKEAAEASGAQVLKVDALPFPADSEGRLSGVAVLAVLAESHLTFHTYPEAGVVFLDIFTCGTTADPWQAYAYLRKWLRPRSTHVHEVSRGDRRAPSARRAVEPGRVGILPTTSTTPTAA